MLTNLNDLTISDIVLAVFVLPETGSIFHKNRSSHGLVFNVSGGEKDYVFSDGSVLKTYDNDVFYLPKGATYEVKAQNKGGCYAVNFDADIFCAPFSVNFRNNEKLLKLFKECEKLWYAKPPFYLIKIKKAVYEIILMIIKEQQKNYLPSKKEALIMPAVEKIKSDFAGNNLSVSYLAGLCGVSEVYFRKIFSDKFGISPKEYITELRINHAKELLKSGYFSVCDTAKLCGYAEPCHFSREFKKRTGESPSEYKY